ncbi:ABC transporter ATP-binding protein [Liquorilactobacillus capillatus]|uniref:Multidrug ABC transporter ATPase n=1 Tax=Liquorilactobacillus capillatus DSM 19910 TaxID=1423731 RepID=A0A0R1LZR3_9LACO|nr:ABC transporter ATP-binding protein [Liquorilactobacillus capillatus]KRL01151.1 multidrug ABC transporter ATPase [Liquorilactobacillus capillatus DSM 19910]
MLAIRLKKIRKSFKQHVILNEVNLEIGSGEIIGLLGPNGAGKSTLIKIMTGLLKSDGGDVEIFGHSLTKEKRLTHYLSIAPQELAFYPQLTVKQNLCSFGELNGLSTKEIVQKYLQVTTIFNLKTLENNKAQNLSGGQKRRLHSAIALMSQAKIIFLDEPTVGADVSSRNQIIRAVKRLSEQGITIIYTTHYLQEMEELNARIVFLNNGMIQFAGALEDVIHKYARPSLKLYFDKQLPNLKGWRKNHDHLESLLSVDSEESYVSFLQRTLADPKVKQYQLNNIKILKANLESAYSRLLEKRVCNEN